MDPISDSQTSTPAVQRVVKVRRDYNTWVAHETIEDYALRFTPRSYRRWPTQRVANTAFGAASFLVLEAVGATLLVHYGFTNAAWAIFATGLVIFLCGLPVSIHAARHGLDMDLLTRGAGFGYIGSTITSLIYAGFTFIFFALEAAVMAYALELAFAIPPALGYLICALAVIPLATHGVTVISRLQTLTQPIWLILLALPFFYVLWHNPGILTALAHYPGAGQARAEFDLYLFGAAFTVGIALITQMAEQVDYLRFMPPQTAANRRRWYLGVLIGGPGWVFLGVAKMLGGALLAYLALSQGATLAQAVDPARLYLLGFDQVFAHRGWAMAAMACFVVISQLKINVTNAYAGSLAWSNFFARLTHSHPGRVVWMIFNTLIALMLMEMGVFQALGQVLGLYANIAVAWIVAVVADLVINKPLGLSPPGIEFRRAYLYDINPVGLGAMALASACSVAAYLGAFGLAAQAFSSFIAIAVAFVSAPLIAWATRSRYYLARPAPPHPETQHTVRCTVCEREYEAEDTAHCPAYQGPICSLCCALDARCHDRCKPQARIANQWLSLLQALLPRAVWPYLEAGLANYLLVMGMVSTLLTALMGALYYHERVGLHDAALGTVLLKTYFALLLTAGVATWWVVLTYESRRVAQEESERQTHLLMQEIASHQRTDEQLQRAKQTADAANKAKSRYIHSISHELRTPLNSILGYAQILDGDPSIPQHRQQAIRVIRKSGDHLLSLIEGTLDIARIEAGKLTLDTRAIEFPTLLQQLARMFELQAGDKGLKFVFDCSENIPLWVRADEKRLRQILINLLGNAVKFTDQGEIRLRVRHLRDMASFDIEDTGPGIGSEELERIFEPFARGSSQAQHTSGTGLGLTIARMLTELMGGALSVRSEPGQGTAFKVRLFLPQVQAAQWAERTRSLPTGYEGPARRILIVDNEAVDREMLLSILAPLGFELEQAASGEECLQVLPRFAPELIFMDLAMPGIDGWETIRRIRAGALSSAKIAVISANAFDKGLDHDVGLAEEDFILKPVRVAELLDWIGQRLALTWRSEPAPAQPAPSHHVTPPAAMLAPLLEQVDMGYVRGIQAVLNNMEHDLPDHAAFVGQMRAMVANFQLDAMSKLLRGYLHAS